MRFALFCAIVIALALPALAPASFPAPVAVRRAVQVWPRSQRSAALAVAYCESRFQTGARNGQYLGLWQLGTRERRLYGYGRTALAQARSAHRLWLARGWRPWACRP